LKTNGQAKERSDPPTMCLIINGLAGNLVKIIYFFQYHSLWKSLKIVPNTEQTHDVYDQKGVRLKTGKGQLLFSIGYLQENDANWASFGVKPTMCMMDKDLAAHWKFSPNLYVIEKRARSSLALKKDGLRTHDVYEAQWFSPRRFLVDSSAFL
jgi:hypothetical protein